MRLPAAILLAVLTLATAAAAAPRAYTLDAADSRVGFSVPFGPDRITGVMPVRAAEIVLDFARASNSRVAVTLDAANAQASFPFATQALRGPKVLDTGAYPTISFASTDVQAIEGRGAMAKLAGDITIRGVTRPVSVTAEIFRRDGSAPDDLSRLSVHLTGEVARSAFGADGWSDMVGDTVTLDILVRIDARN